MTQVSSPHHESSGWPVWIIVVALVGALVVVAAEKPLTTTEVARISGRLTLEGRPMQRGHSVVFMEPSRGDLAFGDTDDDGRFVVNSWKNGEMVPGRYKVYIMPPSLRPGGFFRVEDTRGDSVGTLPNEYHDRYLQKSTTPLEYNIVVGENWFEIDLERKERTSAKPKDDSPSDGKETETP
jgi:hypothetical protein